MPPSNKVVVVRPDGSTLTATKEEAQKLSLLGYKLQSAEEAIAESGERAREEYYSNQKLETISEGFNRGWSLGASDYLMGNEHTGPRRKYNPGLATAAEIGGAVAAEFIPGLNAIAPSALVTKGAKAVAGGTSVGAKIARGAIEGGAFGGAMAADHAYLAGDPITSEAVLHGIGWGSLFGAGLTGAGGLLSRRGASNVARGAAQEAEAVAAATPKGPTPGSYASQAEPAFVGFRAEAKRVAQDLKESLATTEAVLSNNRKKIAQLGFNRTMEEGAIGRARIEVASAFKRFSKTLNKQGLSEEKITAALEQYENVVAKAADKAGLTQTGSGRQALMEFAQAKVLQKELAKFPHSAEAFAKMSDKRAEALFATLGEAKKLSNYSNIASALEGQANKLQEALGLQPAGIDGLRKAWGAARQAIKAEKTSAKTAPMAVPEPGLLKRGVAAAAGFGAYKATAVATGHPLIALGVGSKARNAVLRFGAPRTPELVAARNATLGRLKQAVGRFQVKTGNVTTRVGPKIEPLTIRLDGTADTSTTDKGQLAMNRLSEFASAAPHVKDTLYRAIEPIAIEQPELGPAMHQSGVAAFNAMRSLLPTDPGVVSGLKPIWKPSSLQASVMSQQLSVWQDPVTSAEEMLATGIFDPIRVKTLKQVAPAVYEHMRTEMIGKIQEPGFLDNMSYRDQVALGALIEIPIHSSMRPEFIAASQQLHTTRNQPLPTPAVPGSTNGGRPAADTPGATAAQITTAR